MLCLHEWEKLFNKKKMGFFERLIFCCFRTVGVMWNDRRSNSHLKSGHCRRARLKNAKDILSSNGDPKRDTFMWAEISIFPAKEDPQFGFGGELKTICWVGGYGQS